MLFLDARIMGKNHPRVDKTLLSPSLCFSFFLRWLLITLQTSYPTTNQSSEMGGDRITRTSHIFHCALFEFTRTLIEGAEKMLVFSVFFSYHYRVITAWPWPTTCKDRYFLYRITVFPPLSSLCFRCRNNAGGKTSHRIVFSFFVNHSGKDRRKMTKSLTIWN